VPEGASLSRKWEASLTFELPAGIHPDDLRTKLDRVVTRLAQLDYVWFETDPEVVRRESSFIRVVVQLEAAGEADASTKAVRAVESAADAAGLPVTSARVLEVHRP
jgi:hypothetical protein